MTAGLEFLNGKTALKFRRPKAEISLKEKGLSLAPFPNCRVWHALRCTMQKALECVSAKQQEVLWELASHVTHTHTSQLRCKAARAAHKMLPPHHLVMHVSKAKH